jgi:transcriptional regulator with XRE-family HTH domain
MKHQEILARIRQIRRSKGISQSTMANALFMAIKTYQNMENGLTKIDIERLERIAKVLEVPLEELLGRSSYEDKYNAAHETSYFEQLLAEKERYIARLEADLKLYETLLKQQVLPETLQESLFLK